MQDESGQLVPAAGDAASGEYIIDEQEYRALEERVLRLRREIWPLHPPRDPGPWTWKPDPELLRQNRSTSLSTAMDFDPWHFLGVFDRVHLEPGYAPDFILTLGGTFFPHGPELGRATFTFTTRRVMWHFPSQQAPRGRVRREASESRRHGLERRLQQGFEGLVFEQSVWGCVQFVAFCMEVKRWAQEQVGDWLFAADWQWVCSRERLEAIVPALRLSGPPAPTPGSHGLPAERWQWLRDQDPHLHVRIRGREAEVGGLAHSPFDGLGWLTCDVAWPNRFSMQPIQELGMAKQQRPIF